MSKETSRDLKSFLRQSLEDHRMSRGEAQALEAMLDGELSGKRQLRVLLAQAFDLARGELASARDVPVLDWLQEVVRRATSVRERGIADGSPAALGRLAEAWFLPDPAALGRLVGLIKDCKQSLDVCVFTITHDELSGALLDAHRRGVKLRVITDDDKAHDRGSDIDRLREAGVAVETDDTEAHMHHKYAVFDGHVLLTGSYNWTRSASRVNQENFLLSDDPRLVSRYTKAFDELWRRFAPGRRAR